MDGRILKPHPLPSNENGTVRCRSRLGGAFGSTIVVLGKEHLARYLSTNSSLKPPEIDQICSHFRLERFRKEARIVKQGRPYGKLIYVTEGILRVFVLTPEGDEIVKNFIQGSEFFADLDSIEKDQPAVLNLSAITDCALLTLSRGDAGRLAKVLPDWEHLMREGARRAMYETIRKQEFLRIGTSADQYRYFAEHFPNLIQQVPLKYVASYLGVTQSSLSRIRKERRR